MHGQRDALDSWSRHGAQLVRLLSLLLSCGLSVRSGTATIMAPYGGEWLFRFDDDVLAYLGGASGSATPRYAPQTCLSTWQSAAALVADFAFTRRAGAADGGALRRVTEPLAVAAGVVPALCVGLRETERVSLVPAPTSDSESAALAELARRVPLVVVHMGAMPDEAAQDAQTAEWPVRFYWSERGDTHMLPERLHHATLAAERTQARSRMDEMLNEARQRGVLAERLIAERLACTEEELAERMREPTTRAELNGLDLGYVEGFGLCRMDVLARAHAAAAEVTHTRKDQPVGPAWTARVLGRRLREVTGMGEGIECLIAYLGAA